MVRAEWLLAQLPGPLVFHFHLGPTVEPNHRLGSCAPLNPLLVAVVTLLAEGLERTCPERFFVPAVRFNVIAYCRCYDAAPLGTEATQGLLA